MRKIKGFMMNVKQLELSDVQLYSESIKELIRICLQSTYTHGVTEELIDEKFEGMCQFIQDGKAYVYGAIISDCLVAFLWGYPMCNPFEEVFHIAYIAVSEQGRRQGIGEKMILAAEAEAKKIGINKVELIVGANNRSALSFYEHCGYSPDRFYLVKDVK